MQTGDQHSLGVLQDSSTESRLLGHPASRTEQLLKTASDEPPRAQTISRSTSGYTCCIYVYVCDTYYIHSFIHSSPLEI